VLKDKVDYVFQVKDNQAGVLEAVGRSCVDSPVLGAKKKRCAFGTNQYKK